MAQLLPTFSELRNHITHVLNCCELGDLETQWEDFLLRSIAKKCYPGWRKKTSWYLPLKREKRGIIFCDRDVVSLSSQEGRFFTKETTRISSKDTVQQISCWIFKSETDEWLLNSCVKCKRASPCTQHPQEAAEKAGGREVDGGRRQQSMHVVWCFIRSWSWRQPKLKIWNCLWWTPRMCAQILRTCSVRLSGSVVSPSRAMTISRAWNWSVATFGPACVCSRRWKWWCHQTGRSICRTAAWTTHALCCNWTRWWWMLGKSSSSMMKPTRGDFCWSFLW